MMGEDKGPTSMRSINLLSAIAVFLMTGGPIQSATSASPPTISVYPARTFVKIKPGENYSGFYIIKNPSNQTLSVKVWAEDWTHIGQGRSKESPDAWLTLSHRDVIIPPGEESKITYEVKFSSDITGEKLSQVFFEPSYLDSPSGMIKARNGVLIIAIAKGTEKSELKLGSLKLVPKNQDHFLKLELSNLGNVHLKWQARIVLLDHHGQESGQAEIKSPKSLLTGETQSYFGKIENYSATDPQQLSAKIKISYGIENDIDLQQEMILPVSVEEPAIP